MNNKKVLLSSVPNSVQHICSTPNGHFYSAALIPRFTTKNPSVPRRKTVSSTHPSIQHQKPLCSTHASILYPHLSLSSTHLSGSTPNNLPYVEGCVELRAFGVKLRDFQCWKGVVLVLNWCVELEGLCGSERY